MKWTLSLLFFLVPLSFFPFTVDPLELPKQTVFVVLTCVALLFWLVAAIKSKNLRIRTHGLFLLLLFFVGSVGVSAAISHTPLLSFFGQSSQEYQSFLTALVGAMLVFLLVQMGDGVRPVMCDQQHRQDQITHHRPDPILIMSLLLSAVCVGVTTVLQVLGIPVFGFLGQSSRVFNLIGSLNDAALFLVLMTVLGEGFMSFGATIRHHVFFLCLVRLLSLCTLFLLVVLDYWVLSIILLIGLLFALLFSKHTNFSALFLIVIAFLLLVFPSPFSLPLPVEVMPSYSASWHVVRQTLSDPQISSLFGSGPGTFVFDFSRFKDAALNQTDFWNVRFDRAASASLTLLATYGLVGLTLLFVFTLLLLFALWKRHRATHTDVDPWIAASVGSFLALLFAMDLYTGNMTLTFLFYALTGMLLGHITTKVRLVSFGQTKKARTVVHGSLGLTAIVTVTFVFVAAQRLGAEIALAQAVRADNHGANAEVVTQALDRAAQWNTWSDVYRRHLAESLLAQVKQQSESKQKSDLIAASVEAARQATDLSPRNVANWEVQGAVYEGIADFVDGADAFAILAYKQAHALEPTSPVHLVSLARADVAVAKHAARLIAAGGDKALAQSTQQRVEENLQLAQDALGQAIELKPDYGPAHYELALVYEAQGRLAEAVAKMEGVKQYHPLDVGVAFELGILYLRQGKNDLAKAEFERVIVLVPSYANAHWYLAAIDELQGDLDSAIGEINAVLALDPTNEIVKEKLLQLQTGVAATQAPPPLETHVNE